MPLFLVRYHYTDDVDARIAVRPTHRQWLHGLGPMLVGSGPTDDNGAALVLEADEPAALAALLDQDPFAAGGFIAERTIVGWTVASGRWAEAQG